MAQPLYPSFTPTYHHDEYPAIDPTQPGLDCSSKIILVTGAGQGIGKAIAVAFAKAHAQGIALLGRTPHTLAETAAEIRQISPQTDVFASTADITVPSQVQAAVDSTVAHFDSTPPHVLVNNAGGLRGRGALIDVDLDDFWAGFELNTKGPLIVAQAFLRAVRQHAALAAPRTVINIPSGGAHLPYAPGAASYACSKLASAKIFEYLYHEHPAWTVFNMQPGVVATKLARQAGRKAPDAPELPAGCAVWLATQPEARALNGRFLWANWDVDELLQRKDDIQQRGLLTLTLKGWADDASVEELTGRARSVHRDADREKQSS